MFTNTESRRVRTARWVMIPLLGSLCAANATDIGGPYGFGSTPDAEELAAITIAIAPDGRHLPAGQGDAIKGEATYLAKCVACHGADLKGIKETGGAALVGGRDSLASGSAVKTVESYWPYATTVFDYVRRAMPFNAPGSLSDDEVYEVVAYILAKGNIIDNTAVINRETLPEVRMPNRDGFIPDARPDVRNYN